MEPDISELLCSGRIDRYPSGTEAETIADGSAKPDNTVIGRHDLTYSAIGSAVTAKCSHEGCPLTDGKAVLGIVKPELAAEGGKGSPEAALTGSDEFADVSGWSVSKSDIRYTGRDGTQYPESSDAPAKAGSYTAEITVGELTASVDYTIVLLGDVYTDKRVNMKDLARLQMHLNDPSVTADAAAADLNCDKKVNMKDYVSLQRYLNNWDDWEVV